MNVLPINIGSIHLTGIGGIGMSGIAEILHNLGYRVQGSDLSENANVKRLRALGIPVSLGQAGKNLDGADVVVISTAIKPDNPELIEARTRRLPVVRRAEMLGELMRLKWSVAVAGTHGKTTTTSIIAAMLDSAGMDPTVINGGIINAYGTNARLGSGDWMVVEADESDGSFLRLPATIAVITNIDPEHMEFYGDFEAVKDAYLSFVERLPFYGVAAMCVDHPEVRALMARIEDRRIVTYGFSPQADIQALEHKIVDQCERFDVIVRDPPTGITRRIEGIELAMRGRHNVENALAAIAIACELKIPDNQLRAALRGLKGVKRRFTQIGIIDDVTIIDDYGHHPIEIAAVLKTARQACDGQVIAVIQPHRYSRLADLFDAFCGCCGDADIVVVAPVFAAGEAPISGIDHASLAKGMAAQGQRVVEIIDGEDALAPMLKQLSRPNDMVVCLGAGSISTWANNLPKMWSGT